MVPKLRFHWVTNLVQRLGQRRFLKAFYPLRDINIFIQATLFLGPGIICIFLSERCKILAFIQFRFDLFG
ncbi:hypothetical protein D3C76_1521060 [compost metagenome]